MTKYLPEGYLLGTIENKLYQKSISALEESYRQGRILESIAIVCDSNHNLWVDLNGIRGKILREEGAVGIEDGSTRDIALISRVNKPVCFVITGFETDETGKSVAVLSRRAVQQQCMENHIATLKPGDIIPARVTHLESFGCFVDIGCGISSLLPIDAISVSRISHPKERFKNGQDLRVVVKSIDEYGRICLTHKELLGTWEENAALFMPGETVAGIIRSVESYGVFVELSPNLAGLAEARDDVYPGQHASVYIKSLIPEKMKVKLIIVDAFDSEIQYKQPQYFYKSNHISVFTYSPPCSEKLIETVFE